MLGDKIDHERRRSQIYKNNGSIQNWHRRGGYAVSSTYRHRSMPHVFCTGTNTDAVILKAAAGELSGLESVISWSKVATTPDVTTGIEAALRKVLRVEESKFSAEEIQYVSIGTTVSAKHR